MPLEKFETAASFIAASALSNVLAGRKTAMKPYVRTIQGLAVIIRDNTPALGDITWRLFVGDTEVASGRGILANTTAGEYRFPDDFDVIGIQVPGGMTVTLDVTNADSGGAHGVGVGLAWDRF